MLPGFIDLQVNGYKGVDFSSLDLTTESFLYASEELLKTGTKAFLPTLISSPLEVYKKNLPLIAKAFDHPKIGPHLLGIHMEGPFISKEDGARGAHTKEYLLKPNLELFNQFLQWSNRKIKLITMAAELEGAVDLCIYAQRQHIVVSLGHQMATYRQLLKLMQAGARSLTHLGNGLPHQLNRHDNPLLGGLVIEELRAMIIADGFHLPSHLIQLIIGVKGTDHCILVSDLAPIGGLPPGKYKTLGNEAVLDASGKLYNPKTGYMVGSASTLTDCANFLLEQNLAGWEEINRMGYYNPIKLLGIQEKELPKAWIPLVVENSRILPRFS